MVKVGDTVRYLNDVGGGRVVRLDGKIAYVEDNGFENPVLASELVVIVPAGHVAAPHEANLMFNQKARDAATSRKEEAPAHTVAAVPAPLPAPETAHGDKLNLLLAFEPSSTKEFSKARFNAVLVNDSNYYLDFCCSRRGAEEREWTQVYRGTVAPNELIDLAVYTHEELPGLERIALQGFAYKQGKSFELKKAVDITLRPDLTKFHKLHCFRPTLYFDTPVLELTLLKEDKEPTRTIGEMQSDREREREARRLSEKFRVDARRKERGGKSGKSGKSAPDESNPHKLLPLIEVDLHIGELTYTTAGMDNSSMMELQLAEVRRTMKAHSRRIGQKIVFIHGKGEGVLRNAVLSLLKKEYPKATLQDASFREYGFGATLVTIH